MQKSRRKFLKGISAVAGAPLAFNATNLLGADEKQINSAVLKNGEINTAAHWGMLKVGVKDGKVISSKPYLDIKIKNPMQDYTGDLVNNIRENTHMLEKAI